MGFVYFLMFILVAGAVIYWYGHRSVSTPKKVKHVHSAQQRGRKAGDTVLSMRRNAVGRTLTNADLPKSVDQTDIWKKDHQRRRDWFNQKTESIHGTKYSYTPPPKSRSSAGRSS